MRKHPKTWRHVLAAAVAFLGCLVMGCTAGYPNDGNSIAPTASSTPSTSIPPDGITLAELGYLNGPTHQFSLPRTAVITAKVDQLRQALAAGVDWWHVQEYHRHAVTFGRPLPADVVRLHAARVRTRRLAWGLGVGGAVVAAAASLIVYMAKS